jgi:hypothetical protein
MSHFDVFNGDADGICALQQLRLHRPCDAVPVTGVKRDIALLKRVPARAGDSVTVLDVSLARNRDALGELLSLGVAVEYFDHHFAGEIPAHPMLAAHIDPDPAVCTSVLVDRHLQGRHRAWAVTGAFGDNLPRTATTLAGSIDLGPRECEALRALGEAINYNAYGESEEDLQVAPARLAVLVRPYEDPLAFAADSPVARALVAGKEQDLAVALAVRPEHVLAGASVVLLPDAAWARRVHGALANALSQREPARAHAVLCPRVGGHYVVSVRAPRDGPQGADALCLAFPTGGGRAGSAGIDALPAARVDDFLRALASAWPG